MLSLKEIPGVGDSLAEKLIFEIPDILKKQIDRLVLKIGVF